MNRTRTAADLDRRCVSRRKPKLRVVGEARPGVRKANVLTFRDGPRVYHVSVEVFGFAEWEALPEWERPEAPHLIPEVGYACGLMACGEMTDEMKDVVGSAQQWRDRMGP